MSDEEHSEPKFDKYGQIIVPYSLTNVWSWKPRWRICAAGFAAGFSVPFTVNYFMRRPMYASLPMWSISIASITAAGYISGYMYERRHKLRDQIIDHYTQLHPHDFEMTKREFRKFKDILLPWDPIRGHERPIVWMDKKDWAEK